MQAARQLPLDLQSAAAGMYCVGWLPEGLNADDVVRAAEAQGVALSAVSNFSLEPLARKGVILGFSEHPVADIQAGVRRLAATIRFLAAPSRNAGKSGTID